MPTDIAKALRAELSASQLDALVTRRENSLLHHDIATQANARLAAAGAPNSGFFDQMLPMLETILAALSE